MTKLLWWVHKHEDIIAGWLSMLIVFGVPILAISEQSWLVLLFGMPTMLFLFFVVVFSEILAILWEDAYPDEPPASVGGPSLPVAAPYELGSRR